MLGKGTPLRCVLRESDDTMGEGLKVARIRDQEKKMTGSGMSGFVFLYFTGFILLIIWKGDDTITDLIMK